jgi:hypothetical protein
VFIKHTRDQTMCFPKVPDIQNSDEWATKLALCQKLVLGRAGDQGGGLDRVVKDLHFAKQRFDSYAVPQRHFCCMVVAISLLLAYQASDWRNKKEVRDRARRRLEEMPDHLFTAGVSASYSEEMLRFARLFDKDRYSN